jgi:hypothetical protein
MIMADRYDPATVELVVSAWYGADGIPHAVAVLDALAAAGKLRDGDPAATFERFWADLVTTDGRLDEAKVRDELHDYYLIMGEVSRVYGELTGGRISKPNTHAHHVTCPTAGVMVRPECTAHPPVVHKPFSDDGVLYCGWSSGRRIYEGCGEMWPCATVRARATKGETDVG